MAYMGENVDCAGRFPYTGDCIRFELQAIAHACDLSPYGYEFLFRGDTRPASADEWRIVDEGLLRYLGEAGEGVGETCFVNLSHESVLAIPECLFRAVFNRHDVRFEMSEALAEGGLFTRVCEKVNHLTRLGAQFAIDDFGAGLDGSRRLYALDQVAAIKVDRDLLVTAAGRPQAGLMLQAAVASWKHAGIQTIAEGVESLELLTFAKDAGFELVQGWYIDEFAPSKSAYIQRAFF